MSKQIIAGGVAIGGGAPVTIQSMCNTHTEDAEATIAQLREYDVVMWEKHGVCAVGPDIFEAFDQVDVLSKSAQIYLTARSMGFEPAGTTQEQMDELKRAFNL